ncbi:MAG: hypothetical protein U0746_08760 [Gemmataceae bacterium]
MTLPVVLRRAAQAEFDDAADWYDAQRVGAGPAFTAAVRTVFHSSRDSSIWQARV